MRADKHKKKQERVEQVNMWSKRREECKRGREEVNLRRGRERLGVKLMGSKRE